MYSALISVVPRTFSLAWGREKALGTRLEEEANMAEIEDAWIRLPNIDGFFIPLLGYCKRAEGQRNSPSCHSAKFFW